MNQIEEYLANVRPAEANVIRRYYARALELVPEAVPGIKYGMASLTYRDRGLVAVVARSHGYSLYPFGAEPIALAKDLLDDLPTSSGAVRFTAERLVPDAAFDQMVLWSRDHIDAVRGPRSQP